MIVRRVVEARRQHHLEQFPQVTEQSQLAISTSSQRLFPPSLFSSAQAISHSRTPALTEEERKLGDSTAAGADETAKNTGPNQWFGIGRVFSKRASRLRKRSAVTLRNSQAPIDEDGTEGGDQTIRRSKSVSHAKEDDGHEHTDKQQTDGEEEPVKASWWRRILCA